MARPSSMIPLGSQLPDATLPDVRRGGQLSLSESVGQALVVVFLCNHCPYVKHVREGLVTFHSDYVDRGVVMVGISSNDAQAYPDDAPAELARVSDEVGYRFPILFDEDQTVAKAFSAACTPDIFVYGPERTLVYRGQFDDSRPRNDIPVTGNDLRAAVDAVLSGGRPSADQRPAVGCSIKWKPGNEPA